MLQTIRSKTHGAVAWVVIILIGFVFAVWGIEGYLSSGNNEIAVVNDEVITVQQFQRTYEQLLRQQQMMQALQGGQPVNEELLRQQALNGLVSEKMLATVAHDDGFAVGKAQIDDLLRMLPQFQDNGVYAPEKFESIINNMGYTAAEFRAAAQNDLMIGQVRGSIVDSGFVLPYEIESTINLLEQTRDVDFLMIPASSYLADFTVSDADAQAYFDAHQANYMLPEQVSVEYVRLNADDFTIAAPDEKTLENFYTENQAQYTEPEKRHAAHILLTAEAVGGDEAALNAEAEKIMQSLKEGGDFAALAKEYSQDPGSATQGGDLGWFGRGAMVPEFDQAVFAAQPGEIVGPIKTDFGVHIIKVIEVQNEIVKPFTDVKEEVRTAWMDEQRSTRFNDELAQLDSLAFENPDSLAMAADQLHLTINKTEMINRDNVQNLGALNTPDVIQAIFSDAVLFENKNSEVVYLGPTDVVVLHQLQYEVPKMQDFAAVSDGIKQHLALEQAAKAAHTDAEAWANALRTGTTVAQLQTKNLTWAQFDRTNRYNFALPPEVLDEAFRLHLTESGIAAGAVPIGESDYALVLVKAIYPGEVDPNFAEEMRTEYSNSLRAYKGELDYQLYAAQAQKNSDIDIFVE